MKIDTVKKKDLAAWLELAREVEPLFGPMLGHDAFHNAMKSAIISKNAYCIRHAEHSTPLGIIVISPERNEIDWLAVKASARGKGVGKALLEHAISTMPASLPLRVQTFSATVAAGLSARMLYLRAGFCEKTTAGLNPAGYPTVIFEKQVS